VDTHVRYAVLAALLLAIGSGVGWAGLDTCRKVLSQHLSAVPIVLCLTLGQIPLFGLWLVIEQAYRIAPGYVWPAALSVLLNTLANLLFIRSVQLSPLSLTVPLLSLTPAFTTLMSLLLLREVPTLRQTYGLFLVVAGAFALYTGGGSGALLHGRWRFLVAEPGSLLMIGVAVLWSITAPLDKLATARSTVPLHALVQCGSMALVLLLVLVGRRRCGELRPVKDHVVLLLVAIALSTAAIGLQFMAFQVMLVGLVEVIKRVVGLVAAVLLGRFLFHEAVTMQKLCAIGLLAVGVVLILI
jgi:drug/metabolite transporter (DMT)-like permease